MKTKALLKTLCVCAAFAALGGVAAWNTADVQASALESSEIATKISVYEKASVRKSEPSGIRFIGTVDKAYYESVKATAEFGGKVTFTYGGEDYTYEEAVTDSELILDGGDVMYYQIAITDLPLDSYNVEFKMQSYVKETTEAEKVYSEDYAERSIGYVAGKANAEDEAAVIDDIINVASMNFALNASRVDLSVNGTQTMTVKGTTVEEVSYAIDAPNVATVSADGTVTAVGVGSATLTATVGENVKTCQINVSNVTAKEYELTVEADTNVVADTLDISDLMEEIPAGVTIASYAQVIGDDTYTLTMGENNVVSGVQAGEGQFVLTDTNGTEYVANTSVYTLKIKEAADLDKMSAILNANAVANSATAGDVHSGGYFVLTTNIDYGGNTFDSQFDVKEERNNTGIGFSGTFDGRGYAITNIQMWNYSYGNKLSAGLFGAIAEDGVVKNLHLEASFFRSTGNGNSGVFGYSISGTLQDVYVEIMDEDTEIASHGLLAVSIEATAVLERIVIRTNMKGEHSRFDSNMGWIAAYFDNEIAAKHVYVIHEGDGDVAQFVSTFGGIPNRTKNLTSSMTKYDVVCGAYFASIEDFASGIQTKITAEKLAEEPTEVPDGYDYTHTVTKTSGGTTTYTYYAVKETTSKYNIDYSEFDSSIWTFNGIFPVVDNQLN